MAGWAPIAVETPIDPSGLKNKGAITNRDELNIAEAENIRKAFTKYLASAPTKLAPFDLAWLLKLHGEMYGDVWKWAGQIRSSNFNVGIPFQGITENVEALLGDLHSWNGYKIDPIEQAARLHHRAVYIHPFENGNGRWSRLIANIWLRLNGHPLIDWPEKTIGMVSTLREEYIAAIKQADSSDLEPLIAMHRRYVEVRPK